MTQKLVIQIPVYNEKENITEVISRIPTAIGGIKDVEIIVINDGSTDNTLEIVKKMGVKNIVNFNRNKGLGEAFRVGMSRALELDADIIVNIDGDAQYRESEIYNIVDPILKKTASVVIGDRQLRTVKGYPRYKLFSQYIANKLVSICFNIKTKDVTSGFRAFSREAAQILKDNLSNSYTYTLESVCVLSKRKVPVTYTPVNIRYPTRQSRLIRSKMYYTMNFIATHIRCFFQNKKVSI